MTKPQDTIGAGEFHYEVKIIGDSNIFGQHDGGGSEGLAGVRNLLYSKVGKDNVKSHTHSDPPHWKIKIRDEHVGDLESFVNKQGGLTFEKGAFQFKGISIKDPSLVDYLLSSDKRVDALEERNVDLNSQLDKIETEHSELKDEYSRIEKLQSRTERSLIEARQAANIPRHVVPKDTSDKKRASKLYDRIETRKLYSAAGAEFDQKDLEYYTAKDLLKNEFDYESVTKLVKRKTQIDRRIEPICNFTESEIRTIIINDDIPLEDFLIRGADLFDENSPEYMTSRERTDFFGKDLGNRLRDHFSAIRSLKRRDEELTELQNESIQLERIRLAYEQHSDAQTTRADRERIGKRVHKRLNRDE